MQMTRSYLTPVTVGPLGDLLGVLLAPGVAPRITVMLAVQCEWCGGEGALTTLRVYGQPRADVDQPVELVECCGECGPTVIRRAQAEARDDVDEIVVEVAA
jgi:hypothetical protein